MATDPAAMQLNANLEASEQSNQFRCVGNWTLHGIATLERRLDSVSWPAGEEIVIDASAMDEMDTAGAWLLQRSVNVLERNGRKVRLQGLSPEHAALLAMVQARQADFLAGPKFATPGLLENIGRFTWQTMQQALGLLSFIGENALALLRTLRHPASLRWRAVLRNIYEAGFNALPITGLLSFLMGVVIAYQGAEQLQRYGANIFIVDLVGLSMLRELAPLLTAIIVAGRSGSAYTAQIGTMQVTDEVDALRTIGVPPLELLVLPKILALVIALPLLTVYTDMAGVFGGMVMASLQLGVGFADFLDRFDDAVKLSAYLIGLGKAPVFAAIIAVVGCYQGFQVSGGADSVGRHTTISVVQAIFLVIVADALFSVAFSMLHI